MALSTSPLGLLEGALAVHHAGAGLLAQGLDVLGADLGSGAHAFCSWVAFSVVSGGGLGGGGSARRRSRRPARLRGRGGLARRSAASGRGLVGAGSAGRPAPRRLGSGVVLGGRRRCGRRPGLVGLGLRRHRGLGAGPRDALGGHGLGLGGLLRRAVGLGAACAAAWASASRRACSSASRRARSSASRRTRSSSSARSAAKARRPSRATSPMRVGDDGARLDRVVVAGDDEVDPVRVAVGVDQADDRDAQALRLAHGDRLGLEVDDEHRVGRALHVLHAAEVGAQLGEVGLGGHALARGQQPELALGLVALEVVQAPDALVDGLEVRQQAAEPAVVDVGHAGGLGDVLDGVAGLLLGADEEHDAAALGELAGELLRLLEQPLRLQQVDDVDAAALAVDEAAHLGVPAARLVAEMDPGLQQLPDPDFGHGHSSLVSTCR